MTGLLKNNIVAAGLLGLAGVILLVALVMQLTADIDLDTTAIADLGVSEEFAGGNYSLPGELETYAAIDERPLFNTTRRPIAVVDFEGDRMIVVLQDNETKQFVRTSIGAGMEGPFADWRVDEIGPRSVTLTSFDGESVQLDMKVAETTPAAPGAPAQQPAEAGEPELTGREKYEQAIMNLGQTDNNESRAEEIRRRIAERRAQLQEAADKKAAQDNGKDDDDI
jgi:hypothetical protein